MENKVAAVEKKINSIENTLQDINSKLDVANKYKDDGKEKNDAFFHFQQDLLTQVNIVYLDLVLFTRLSNSGLLLKMRSKKFAARTPTSASYRLQIVIRALKII